ncbi:hypothetical protein [Limnoglobus roseus]|uniref:Uncharacterized protein n=1 Tax=Limnoglobus roseus TaxID=2598579 RepID=A0A5C1A7U2_9BACT|nr:hypothetical protein [Limnoglobus roseus]QEL15261.1 hypothetical protein PX52LOC_02176 [Limnoglobus roseus]
MEDRDKWSSEGRVIVSAERLSAIREVLEQSGPIIVEHRFYYGSCAPDRHIFNDFDSFMAYLKSKPKPGDAIWVWNFEDVCGNDNAVTDGKYPDDQGRVPEGGAY